MEIAYARTAGAHIAYRLDGDPDGPALVYLRAGPISIDSFDDEPRVGAFFRRLGSFAQVIRVDPRGVGLSDPLDGEVTVDGMARDALAVVDAVGVERFAVLGEMSGGPVAIALAAAAPARVGALVLVNTYARVIRDDADDYPYGHPPELVDAFLQQNFD
ncbi:MAG: alpha/beta fold hydrolase, partial [Actinomycetota bacterium]